MSSAAALAWQPFDRQQAECAQPVERTVDHLVPPGFERKGLEGRASFSMEPAFENGQEWQLVETNGQSLLMQREFPLGVASAADIDARQRTVAPETARLIVEIWINTVRETRYPRCSVAGLDGTTYRFSAFAPGIGPMRGEAWSPQDDLPPRWLAEIGGRILDFAKDPDADEHQLRLELREARDRLFRYLKDHGGPG